MQYMLIKWVAGPMQAFDNFCFDLGYTVTQQWVIMHIQQLNSIWELAKPHIPLLLSPEIQPLVCRKHFFNFLKLEL